MKTHSPRVRYLAFLASSGFYAYVWLVELMHDVNELEQRQIFPARKIGLAFVLAWMVYLALILIPRGDSEMQGISHTRLVAMLTLGVSLLLSPSILLVLVSRHVDSMAGRKHQTRNDLAIFFLTFLLFASFPIVQRRMNRLIRAFQESGKYEL